jgi:hypothetical protein
MKKVSGNRKNKTAQCEDVRIAVLTYKDAETIQSSCGWKYRHKREKVREDAADRHVAKRHEGQAIRL